MRATRRRTCLQFLTLLQLLSTVKCSVYTFRRIDKNDNISMAVGFTMIFQACIFDAGCNFIVKSNKYSDLEKMQNTDGGSKLHNVWKKLKKKQGRSIIDQ